MFVLLCLIFFSFYVGQISTFNEAVFTRTPLGGVIGRIKQSRNNRTYEAYEGIPYALPPTGRRRFEPPVPFGKWSKNIKATKPSAPCIQYQHLSHKSTKNRVTGQENCLFLNIYVPRNTSKPLPVLFVLHGGAFQFGKAPTGTRFLMDKDIIVVSINYRLGTFGFLSTEDSIIPGNMGLKDQSLALRWVHDNIQYFGGNPKKITLLGWSAGAASVHYHYLSTMSKGLFQNGISFSGTALGPGKHTEYSLEKARKLAGLFHCDTVNTLKMVDCLKTKPARLIVAAINQFLPWLYNPFTPFGPVIECSGDKPFVNRSAIEIINSGDAADVLWITSTTKDDGLYPVADFIDNTRLLNDLDENWESIAPHLLDYNFTIPLKDHAEVSNRIRSHYLGCESINDTVNAVVDLVSDRLYIMDTHKATKLQAKKNQSPVLLMQYHYQALTSVSNYFTQTEKIYGVSHGDDFNVLFDGGIIDMSRRPEDTEMQNKLLDYVTSVAIDGFPNFGLDFEWKKVDGNKEEVNYLVIKSPTNMQMASDDNIGQRKFWTTINFDENVFSDKTLCVW